MAEPRGPGGGTVRGAGVRRTALLLGVVAVLFYLGSMAILVLRGAH